MTERADIRGAATEAVLARTIEAGATLPPAPPGEPEGDECAPAPHAPSLATMALLAIGVVFGDIGTSPLYAFRAAFAPEYGLRPVPESVYGVLSLITWALILVVSVKYATFIMRADHRGEGGIVALLSLIARRRTERAATLAGALGMTGLFGAALLYGDGMITPALSILSAVEGLEIVTPALDRVVVPVALAIVCVLFGIQRHGTMRIGRFFGPVMLAWFVVLALLAIPEVLRTPAIAGALDPRHAARFFALHGTAGFLVLGAVVLAVTGAEALFSDIGHCGRRPIRVAWFAFVLPCLLLHYFGQGALVLRAPELVSNPFYHLAPRWALLPLVALATVATSIASQAVLTGAFSLTRQLMHLGYSPLVTVHHTSDEQEGQVYVPQVNFLLFAGCVVLILAFGSSQRLEAAYGLAVTGTMTASSLLFFAVTRTIWRWPLPASLLLVAFFLAMDLSFLAANVPKIPHGGWVPLAIAIVAMLFFTTWRRGRQQLLQERDIDEAPLDALFAELDRLRPCRVPGTAVFLTLNPNEAPSVLGRHLDSIPALHEQVVLLAFGPAGVDRVAPARRIAITRLEHGFVRVIARYGFRQRVDVADTLAECARRGLAIDLGKTTFYVSRERILPGGPMRMAAWRKRLFAYLHRNSPSTQDFVGLPADRVVELGAQVLL